MSKKKQIEQILFESEGRVDSVAVDKLLALMQQCKKDTKEQLFRIVLNNKKK